jgi:hypothetical protein
LKGITESITEMVEGVYWFISVFTSLFVLLPGIVLKLNENALTRWMNDDFIIH